MEPLIPINVVIGDRTYRIKIDPKDEETVRGTVKIINDKIIEYKTQFAGKDMQDYIGMVVLWYATQEKAAASQSTETTEIAEKLNQLEDLLDKSFK
jgi:hypothetical protein